MGFSHLVLNVRDLSISVSFYQSVLAPLGFVVADGEELQYCRLTNGLDMVIVLNQVEVNHAHRPYHRKGTGLNHFAICVSSRDDVDAYHSHLSSLGVPLLGGGTHEMDYRRGYYSLLFEDPDRIMIEVVWHDSFYFSKLPVKDT